MARIGGDGRKLVFMLVPSLHALDTFVSAVNRKPEQLFQAKVFFCWSTSIRALTFLLWGFP